MVTSMAQFNVLPMAFRLAIAATIGLPAVAFAADQPTFAELCAAFQSSTYSSDGSSFLYSRPYAWQTVEAFMSALDTADCQTAEQQLAAIEDLRAPQLQTTYLPDHGLMVDFPVGVDLQTVAIATPNLTALNLSGHVITDLAPITALDRLQTLQVANTQLEDISALSAMPRLVALDISYNQINTIEAVASIPTIRSLNIAYNPVTDVGPIGEILTPATEQEWQLLDLSGIAIDLETCPVNLGDICENSSEGDW